MSSGLRYLSAPFNKKILLRDRRIAPFEAIAFHADRARPFFDSRFPGAPIDMLLWIVLLEGRRLIQGARHGLTSLGDYANVVLQRLA